MKCNKYLRAIKRYLTDPDYRFLLNTHFYLYRNMSDADYLQRMYKAAVGKNLDLENPKTFNEKLQWLKLYDRKPAYTAMVDKYAVKAYVTEQIGEKYIIPTLGVWDRFEDIAFESLPDQFVLKCTHDSGGLVICKDKSKLDRKAAKRKIQKSLKTNYYWHSREWPYKNVKPRIIAEKYMVDDSGTELRDYKVLCFGGEPKLIQYHQGRFGYHTQDFYDPQWKRVEMTQGLPLAQVEAETPPFLEEMLLLSRKLAADIPHIRVDWYYAQNQLYFGELTFFDASGFDEFQPDERNEILGSWITLPEKSEDM